MTAAQLMALLATMPPDLPVGFVNECADEGRDFIEITEARHKARGVNYDGLYNHAPQGFPHGAGALVLG